MKNLQITDWLSLAQTCKKINRRVKYIKQNYILPLNHKYVRLNIKHIPIELISKCKTHKAYYIKLYAENGDINSVKYMLNYVNLEQVKHELLAVAAEFGHRKLFKYLLRHYKKRNIDIDINYGDCYFYYISSENEHVNILSYLLHNYISVDNYFCNKLYASAIAKCNWEIVDYFNSISQSTMDVMQNDCEAMRSAVENNNLNGVKYLLRYWDDCVEQLEAKNHFAIRHAKECGYKEIYEYLIYIYDLHGIDMPNLNT